MELFQHFVKILRERQDDVKELMARGAVDSMEKYQYIVGQINALEATRQELSNLLEDKEQNEGTVIDIKTKQ